MTNHRPAERCLVPALPPAAPFLPGPPAACALQCSSRDAPACPAGPPTCARSYANARTALEARKGIAPAFMAGAPSPLARLTAPALCAAAAGLGGAPPDCSCLFTAPSLSLLCPPSAAFRSGAVMGFLLAGNALLVLFLLLLVLRKVYGDDWEGLYEVRPEGGAPLWEGCWQPQCACRSRPHQPLLHPDRHPSTSPGHHRLRSGRLLDCALWPRGRRHLHQGCGRRRRPGAPGCALMSRLRSQPALP